MLTTDCPICDEPAFVEAALATIECADCGVMDVAADVAPRAELARAA
jgi:transcription initiation factor TFIIIB Brf1 subunit/transcription initiation factor TFIIB